MRQAHCFKVMELALRAQGWRRARMIRVAIIGAGIGAEHLVGYRALPDRFSVATLCDLDTARATAVAGSDAALHIVSDIAAILMDDQIDLVDICLPPHLHAEVAIAALDAGKHVICEKPIARSLAEADAMALAEARSPACFFPGFPVPVRPGPLRAGRDGAAGP
jgi:predicted dehydrogenase